MRYYSKTTGNTYLDGVHAGQLPADAVPISEEQYLACIANPAAGKVRSHDTAGLPILIDPPPRVPTADDHRAAVAARRYQAEAAGIVISGMRVDTGRDSQALITGAALQATIDPAYVCRWKLADGSRIDLDAATILGVATAVRSHVQACFDREDELLTAIEAGTYKPAMLEEGWPDGSVPAPPAG